MEPRIRFTPVLLLLTAPALAQPTLNAGNNIPGAPSTYAVTVATAWDTPGSTGSGTIMGHWMLLGTDNRDIKYLNPSVTPTSNQVPNANLISTDGGSDTLFWRGDANGMEILGEKVEILGLIPYTDGVRELVYPLTYNTTWTDVLTANYSVSGLPVTRTGSLTGNADSWGTLELPAIGIENVLRVHVRKQITDASAFITIQRTYNTWYFFTDTVRHPVLRMQVDSISSGGGAPSVSKEAQWLYGNGFANVGEFAFDDVVFTPYPNPASGPVDLLLDEAAGARELEVADATGRIVLRRALPAREGRVTGAFNTQALAPGLYTLRLTDGQRVLGAQRLVVR